MTHKQCPVCQAVWPIEQSVCGRCNHQFRTRFDPNQTQAFQQPYAYQQQQPYANYSEPPNTTLIAVTWVCFALSFLGVVLGPLALVAWLASVGTAIALVCTKNRTNKINGWVCIGLNSLGCLFLLFVVGLLAVLMGATAARQQQRTPGFREMPTGPPEMRREIMFPNGSPAERGFSDSFR